MSSPLATDVRSLRTLRWRARAPRLLAGTCFALLALAGLRAAVAPVEPQIAPIRAAEPADQPAGAFAEAFARAYLTWDPAAPERRERLLAGFLSRELDPDAGMVLGGRGEQRVDWTAVASERRDGGRTTVVVAAELGGETLHIAVPVERDERGFLAVTAYPALVGATASDRRITGQSEPDVDDPELRAVSERAVRNYLAGQRRNLAADLADGATVTLPTRRLAVEAVESITWAGRRRVAVQVRAAEADAATWTLRYVLAVVRRERWYVRSLHVNPQSKGVS
jgi:hypothetical protein